MRVLLTVCTNDEAGQHFAGETVDVDEAIARTYLERGWASKVEEEKPKEPAKKEEAAIESKGKKIETPEDRSPKPERANITHRHK